MLKPTSAISTQPTSFLSHCSLSFGWWVVAVWTHDSWTLLAYYTDPTHQLPFGHQSKTQILEELLCFAINSLFEVSLWLYEQSSAL